MTRSERDALVQECESWMGYAAERMQQVDTAGFFDSDRDRAEAVKAAQMYAEDAVEAAQKLGGKQRLAAATKLLERVKAWRAKTGLGGAAAKGETTMKRLKVLNGHTALARFLADGVSEAPVGFIPRHKEIPSPYAFSSTDAVYDWNGTKIIWRETRQRRYEVFEVTERIYATDDFAHEAALPSTDPMRAAEARRLEAQAIRARGDEVPDDLRGARLLGARSMDDVLMEQVDKKIEEGGGWASVNDLPGGDEFVGRMIEQGVLEEDGGYVRRAKPGKGATFRLTGEVVHVLRRADPRGWLALDDLALQAQYERVAGRVQTRGAGPTDVERWTAEIYNAFSTLRRRQTFPSGQVRETFPEHREAFQQPIGLRLHEAFQLAQACKKAHIAGRGGGGGGRGAMSSPMAQYVAPTMEALGFAVYGVREAEYVEAVTVRTENGDEATLDYVNTGDTYSPTIGWDDRMGVWWFGSYGDWVEQHEAREPEDL